VGLTPALVVFDLAGTTVRDSGQVPAAFAAALAESGIAVTAADLTAVRGASKRQAVLHLIPEGPERATIAEAAYAAFRDHLTRLYRAGGVEPIAGAAGVFSSLRARGVRVALNTGFDRDITSLLIDTLGWNRGVVDAVVCGDDVERGRPAPDLIRQAMAETGTAGAASVCNVGDTVLDLMAGRSAGVGWNVGVLSGAHDRSRLEAAPHTHLFDSVADVLSLWP
jgi:phosphonatase-like hydrolase